MKQETLDASRKTLGTHLFGPMNLERRRNVGTKPLNHYGRRDLEEKLRRVRRECEGIATVFVYGHPSRRMLIAYPLAGFDWRDASKAVQNCFVVSGNVSCGNYVFSAR